ncbi:hypothetical protein VNI00_015930 [Paramarasmius palmivorus]|uniref:Cytochrome P450 n=1 Tax=Paramarasmius palmivorus TaxID=297713 RepID=A0AAW0BFY6_9AGAR
METGTKLLILAAALFLYWHSRRKSPISRIRGPKSKSWLVGNLEELLQPQAGEADFKWQSLYGGIVRYGGTFGDERLFVADPKAIQHILHAPNYRWERTVELRQRTALLSGPGITAVTGDDHRRQRRVMQPSFGAPASRELVPIFSSAAVALTNAMKDSIVQSGGEPKVFNVSKYVSRATLDAIGHAGFDYHFGAMENADNRLAAAYNNLFADAFASPTKAALVSMALPTLLPFKLLEFMLHRSNNDRAKRIRLIRDVSRDVARQLLKEKAGDIDQGKGNKDVMSLLVKANLLSDEELLSQMTTIFTAGHETTSNSISWTLVELGRRPEIQNRLREEILAKKRELAANGNTTGTFVAEDFDTLPYLNAVLKESLRYSPVIPQIQRVANEDDVIPLSEPIVATDGQYINEVTIHKGQKVVISINGYNRDKSVFGEDAQEFNPDRWLNSTSTNSGSSVGVYANLATFAGGHRGCIGWRFARRANQKKRGSILEMQAFLVELISNFEFSATAESSRIRREAAGVMIPTLEGELEKGVREQVDATQFLVAPALLCAASIRILVRGTSKSSSSSRSRSFSSSYPRLTLKYPKISSESIRHPEPIQLLFSFIRSFRTPTWDLHARPAYAGMLLRWRYGLLQDIIKSVMKVEDKDDLKEKRVSELAFNAPFNLDPEFLKLCLATFKNQTLTNHSPIASDTSRLTDYYPAAYKDFYGLPSNPPCRITRQVRPIYNHPIADQWHTIGTSIYEFLDSQNITWTSIDPVAFAEEGEVQPFCPFLMWIGVYPKSLPYNAAVAAAEAIKKILALTGFPEIEVAFRPKSLSFDPLRDPVPELLKPFTPTLGLSIASLRMPYFEGTGALYFRVSNANNRTVLLTAAHVVRLPAFGMSCRHDSQAAEEIVALGYKGYNNAVTNMLSTIGDLASSIDIWKDNIARLPEPVEGEDEDEQTVDKRQEYQDLVNKATRNIEKINKLHSNITKYRTTLAQRTIGSVLHVEPITVSDGPHHFTSDWALIELYEEKIDWKSFKGNQVYIGGNLSPSDYGKIMFPRPEDQGSYKYPRDGLLQAYSVVKDKEIRSPQQFDANGKRGAFSAPGDSGAIVLERGGGIVGMVTGGGGTTEENDITYLTPYWWLEEQIKKVLPGCYLYDVVH